LVTAFWFLALSWGPALWLLEQRLRSVEWGMVEKQMKEEKLERLKQLRLGALKELEKEPGGSIHWHRLMKQVDRLEEEIYEIEGDGKSSLCLTCGCELGLPGGYEGTDLCGPCCCGEAELLSERGETW